MFFLFGRGRSTLKNQYPLTNCECPVCHQTNTMVVGTVARYVHFFFIPLFPTLKSNIAICSSCNSQFVQENKQFTAEMEQSFESQKSVNPNSRPIWHGCGCFLILLFVIFLAGAAIIGWFNSNDEPEKPVDKRKEMLRRDLSAVTQNPSLATDSTSFYIKECYDMILDGEINKKEIKYYSKSNGEKILILLDIDDLKKVKASTRYHLIEYIKECLNMHYGYENKQLYIGVDGMWNMVLVSTPHGSDTSGKYADQELLYPFYDQSQNLIEEVEIKASKKKNNLR